MELPDEFRDEIRMHQVMFKRVKNHSLEDTAADALNVLAGSKSARGAAAEVILPSRHKRPTAVAAGCKSRQQMLGTPVKPELLRARLRDAVAASDVGKSVLYVTP
jgi:hypothetical protein